MTGTPLTHGWLLDELESRIEVKHPETLDPNASESKSQSSSLVSQAGDVPKAT